MNDPMTVPRHYGYRIDYRIQQFGAVAISAPTPADAVTIARRLLGITGTELFEVVALTDVDDPESTVV